MITSATRWWALAALTLTVLAVGLDGTILSVALPTLSIALTASEAELQWFFSGYLLVLAAAMLPAALLGDRYGRKKVILIALVLFGVGSIACAYAPSPGAFIAARVVLGIAGATLIVTALSTLSVLFSEAERPRAVGIWAATNFVALPLGPILGGWLLTHKWWGWIFLMNVPVTIVGLIAVIVLLPESRAANQPGLDLMGVVFSSAGLAAVTYGLIEAGQSGWTGIHALAGILGGFALLTVFFAWERRLTRRPGGQPLVDLALFRSAAFTWGVILAAIGALAMVVVLFTMPQYFQGVLGTDAQGSGFRLLPLIAGLVLGAVPADRVAARVGAKITVALGFALVAAAMIVASTTSMSSSEGFVDAWMAVVGVGLGLVIATTASAALSALSMERSGIGSAVLQSVQKVGAPFGATIVGSVLNSAYRGRLDSTGLPPAAASVVRDSIFGGVAVAHRLHSALLLRSVRVAFVHGMDGALTVSAGIAATGLVLALIFLPGQIPKSAEQAEWEYEPEREADALVT